MDSGHQASKIPELGIVANSAIQVENAVRAYLNIGGEYRVGTDNRAWSKLYPS